MHLYLKEVNLTKCQKCGKKIKPHTVCFNCGYYRGLEVVDVLKKLDKKEKKKKEKELKEKEAEGKGEKPLTMEEMSKK